MMENRAHYIDEKARKIGKHRFMCVQHLKCAKQPFQEPKISPLLVQNIEVKNFLVFFQPNALQISYWYAGLKQQGKCRKQKGSKV